MRFALPATVLILILSSQVLADSVTVDWVAPQVSIQRSHPEATVGPPVVTPSPQVVPQVVPEPEFYLQVPMVTVQIARPRYFIHRRTLAPIPPTTVAPAVAVTTWRWGLFHRRAIPRTRIMAGSIYAGSIR
jgi:hypothetical protein